MKRLSLVFLVLMMFASAFSQIPLQFKYQAVLRDAGGNVIANKAKTVIINILQGSITGSIVFVESHNVTTSALGIINLNIGSNNPFGFASINWATSSYFIKINVDGLDMGTSQLLSVPYALHARTVEIDNVDDADHDTTNELQILSIVGNQLSISKGNTLTLPSTTDIASQATRSMEFGLSKHNYGTAAFSESGNVGCTPCHASAAFQYVCKNNISSAFIPDPYGTSRYLNGYITIATAAIGEITCVTCHSSLYTTGDISALTTIAPVSMTFNGGAQTIDLPAKGHISNLCVKCHQPRPFTNSNTNKNVLNYDSLKNYPAVVFYNATQANGLNKIKPSYRTHTHYGTAGAVYAGKGGIEFGTGYTNSPHTTVASCQDCHMAEQTGRAGGHTFNAAGNFAGCNAAGCHINDPISAATGTKYWRQTRDNVKSLLNQLAAKLTIGGVDILNRNGDATTNLWAGLTTNNYDGYLNIYDPINNPSVQTYNTGSFQYIGTPPSTWSQAQKDYNATLPKITLTNAQMGALINFQLCLRDYSLGIHNTTYTTTLLTNTLAALPAK